MKIKTCLLASSAVLSLWLLTPSHAGDTVSLPASAQPAAPAPPAAPAKVPLEPGLAPPGGLPAPGSPARVSSVGYATRLQSIIRAANPGSAGGGTLVVAPSGMESEDLANLQEDMAVMAHILDKAADEKRRTSGYTAMGIDVFFAPGSIAHRNLYLEGYGALFTLSVGFPLLPPAAKAEQKEDPKDSAWEEARQELYGGQPDRAADPAALVEYDEDAVRRLKDALLEALKNASNIRGLKPEDSVVISVLGGATPAKRLAKPVARMTSPPGAGLLAVPPAGDVLAQRTILTISAKKADVDDRAAGKLSPEEFRQKVRMACYAGEVADGGAGAAALPPRSGSGGFGGGMGGAGGGGYGVGGFGGSVPQPAPSSRR